VSVSDAEIAFALDLFADLGGVSSRKMFGGLGLYRDGMIFGLVSSAGTVYLKATGNFAAELKARNAEQFHNMPYWSLPDEALEDPTEAVALANRAYQSLIDA